MELVIRALSKQYPHKLAVDRVSLTLTPGIYGLLGANGAGKTTLMRMLCGILHPTGGEISLDGLGVAQEEYRACLGYLPQDFGYYPGFTGEEFLWYMGALKGLPKAQARRRAKELLELVGLSQAAKGKIKTYSGGMKQRLGIAQALLGHPKLLVLDEPTAGLDPKERVRFRGLIASLGKQSIVLVSTHIVSDLAHIADVILLMTRLPGLFTREEKLAAWAEFEPLCLHDSTLSFATHALFAFQNGLAEQGEASLEKALFLDLRDVMGNTGKEGLHLACMGEAWQAAMLWLRQRGKAKTGGAGAPAPG